MKREPSPRDQEIRRDYYAGALMIAIGLVAVVQSAHYDIGTLTHMGAGFFPAATGSLLVLTGILIAAMAARSQVPSGSRQEVMKRAAVAPEWRGWSCILLSIVAFVGLAKYAGFVPASFAITFISALGDRKNTLKTAFLLALAITVVAVVLFAWGLQLGIPLFGGS